MPAHGFSLGSSTALETLKSSHEVKRIRCETHQEENGGLGFLIPEHSAAAAVIHIGSRDDTANRESVIQENSKQRPKQRCSSQRLPNTAPENPKDNAKQRSKWEPDARAVKPVTRIV